MTWDSYEKSEKRASELLKKKGFSPETIINKEGLYLVFYSSFTNKEEATKELKKIKAESDSEAWMVRQ